MNFPSAKFRDQQHSKITQDTDYIQAMSPAQAKSITREGNGITGTGLGESKFIFFICEESFLFQRLVLCARKKRQVDLQGPLNRKSATIISVSSYEFASYFQVLTVFIQFLLLQATGLKCLGQCYKIGILWCFCFLLFLNVRYLKSICFSI